MAKLQRPEEIERDMLRIGVGVAALRRTVSASGLRPGGGDTEEPTTVSPTTPAVGGTQPVSPIPGVPSALLRHPGRTGGVSLQPLVERALGRYGKPLQIPPFVKR